MKKLFAVLLAIALVLSMGTIALAAETGTITIENAVVGAMPTEQENGVATIGAGVTVGANAKIGPNAMVRNDVKDGEEQW